MEVVRASTGIPLEELKRVLQSLACGQYRVLSKTPKGRDVNDGDLFAFNSEFSAGLVRLRINTLQGKETKDEAAATQTVITKERQHQVRYGVSRRVAEWWLAGNVHSRVLVFPSSGGRLFSAHNESSQDTGTRAAR